MVQTKRPVCVSERGIWLASGEPGRLVVTQVTPEVPGEKHIGEVCKISFEAQLHKMGNEQIYVGNASTFLLHHQALVGAMVGLCR